MIGKSFTFEKPTGPGHYVIRDKAWSTPKLYAEVFTVADGLGVELTYMDSGEYCATMDLDDFKGNIEWRVQ